ncbi:hypothetical protein BW730_02745 [Tessaracoccus aquimaris]|uniref:CARDB domain-containing protein n=1 Tax=Tessaracoccus aquimaris TaxID=1332264 RepID=A0A1Q2CKI0_9ACTN|nr:hypothetical protein [Tessaracoccus aquimaris]AQP46611.1 hypothetical protein BW730_02745 [Tessaracoccus aquimaris]
MKLRTRLPALLILILGLCFVPIASAAGDNDGGGDGSTSQPGGSGTGTDTGSGTGSGSGDGTGGGTGGGTPGGEPGTQGPAGVSVPRVMVEGFSIAPQKIFAGQDFTVNFSLRNTSTKTQVQNLKVTVSSPDAAFLPIDGSSSIYVSRIRAERVSGHTMNFRALPSLEAKPYQLVIAVEYEDPAANAYSSSETLAIEVNQELRADASTPQVTPAMLNIGQQGSMTFSVQNQGKSKLFNAKVTIPEGQALAPAEAFVGGVEPGTSGAVDMTVTAAQPATGPVEVVITYEDVRGQLFTVKKQVEVPVQEAAPPTMPEDDPSMQPPPEEAGFPWLPVGIGAAALLLAVTAFLIVRSARKRKAAREDEASLAALAGDNLVGDDWQ